MAASALISPAIHAVRSASAIVCKEVIDSHVLRIDGYSRLKHMMHGKYIRSGDFHAGGHAWRLLYYPNGSQLQFQDHIAVYLQLASRDPNDEQVLARPRFSLLDQLGNPALPHDCGMHRFSY
ncbi:hypothetical protein D1007_06499 [Hordeum vulgare]|uniref:MATH domain-containing protein n=1 Tax=Hordeum vulgare subsp. vulgare TaxID=112509 RepID=A0A8I6WSC3_HORVV|nr:hypothetical protein D1007_06499 [Hordeum vulgare]KAI4999438.1 hypothetical protein ZWY2020_004027 [Hordeum vulgare]